MVKSETSYSDYHNCPICLCGFDSEAVVFLDVCSHKFCQECITEWSKKVNTCPIDRRKFNYLEVKNIRTLEIIRRIKVEDRTNDVDEASNDLTFCEICHLSNREDRMLLCDGCDRECLNPQIEDIPSGDWFCPNCIVIRSSLNSSYSVPTNTASANSSERLIARTNFAERVRRSVNQNRRTRNLPGSSTSVGRRRPKRTLKKKTRVRKYKRRGKQTLKKRSSTVKRDNSKRTTKRKTKRRKRTSKKINIFRKKAINRAKVRIMKKMTKNQENKNAQSGVIESLTGSSLETDYKFESYTNTSLPPNPSQSITVENQVKPSTSRSVNLVDSILNDFKLLNKNSTQIQVNVDGTLNLVSQNRPKTIKTESENPSDVKVKEKVSQVNPTPVKIAPENNRFSRDQIVEISKRILKPYFVQNKVDKDEYKYILKRVVSKTEDRIRTGSSVTTDKIAKLTQEYAENLSKRNSI